MTREEIEKNKHNLSGVDLAWANLSHAKLGYANLSGANLISADLSYANLSRAYMVGTDLRSANLIGAKLSHTNLTDANLGYAILYRAYMVGASLRSAKLSGASLAGANLSYVGLRGVDLRGAELDGAELDGASLPPFQIPQHGSLTVWGKKNGAVVKLLIEPNHQRTACLINRKCRASGAFVLDVENEAKETTVTNPFGTIVYRVGEYVYPHEYNDDIRLDCAGGIHFWLTREEAEMW